MGGTRLKRPLILAVMGLALPTLAACAGGGGSSTVTPTPTPTLTPAPTPTPTPTPAPVVTPNVSSFEYLRNPGLGTIKPSLAWTSGATGAGQVVAIIDSGVDGSIAELTGRLSVDSTDLITTRGGAPIADRHATEIATVIAANFNSFGTVGVAYQATILSIRTDTPGSCAATEGCTFSSSDIAAGVDYAISHGAKIINLSLGTATPTPNQMQQAIIRATTAGLAVVAAAGNVGDPNPIYPANYATDPRFGGALIAAGALNAAGTDIASFSNRAGTAATGYLLAPGSQVVGDCTPASCTIFSGTSYAAPHIAGALALLMSGFPSLTGAQAVDILLRTADDLGPAGTDSTYGRGVLDIAHAFAPAGSLRVAGSSGDTTAVSADGSAAVVVTGAAFGGALAAPANFKTVGFDDYHRMYRVDLGLALRVSGRHGVLPQTFQPAASTAIQAETPRGGHLTLAARKGLEPLVEIGGAEGLVEARRPDSVAIAYSQGPLSFGLWTGPQGLAPATPEVPADAFSGLAAARQTANLAYGRGAWTFAAEQGLGQRRQPPGPDLTASPLDQQSQPTTYSRVIASFSQGGLHAGLGAGILTEAGGPLGSVMGRNSAYAMPALTRYGLAQLLWAPAPGVTLSARGAVGSTHAAGQALTVDAVSSSWTLEATGACPSRWLCDGVTVSWGQPVRVERGELSAILADQPRQYLDPLTYSRRAIDATPNGRELEWAASVRRTLGATTLSLRADALTQGGNQRRTPLTLGLSAHISGRF